MLMRYLLIHFCLVDGSTRLVTYKEWSDLVQTSFEKCYYIPTRK
jgi:hypothetical protein